ncbi:MAG: bifunctional (p)ppGpp synthetase/guanosine-3',5'-bis(diphosphate) 3'-pyrophosphohydrolase [Bdellovibrionales bacterium]
MSDTTAPFAIEKIVDKVPKTIDELVARISEYNPVADIELIRKAYDFSEKAHLGQIRRSGEPYISHPLGVAAILADLKLDAPTIITGLLHDTVEDTHVTLDDVLQNFGSEISALVDGVTKISRMTFRHMHEKQGENIRKMIIAMGKDVRVILVKLADRLHNMRTLNHMPYDKQALIAQETLDIYAPLANRLGISSIKIELEDLSFRYLKPDMYYSLAQKVAKKKKERERYIEEVKRILTQELLKGKVKAEVQGRPKHLYSIYKKMELNNIDYDEVHDVLAFRVIPETLAQCYEVLGHVHSLWKPIPGRFKDFIAMPKANNYQSLHTTVIGPEGERIEIQIRTNDMHLVAERGIAAHWKYKEKREIDAMTEKRFHWLRDLVAHHQQTNDSNEFLETIKTDLFESEIYVFTPAGEVKPLPDGATPLDFAYSVHTDVGNKSVGAKVNGRIVPLKHKLTSGDTIEIMTSPTQHPSKDWLKMCITSRAQSKIRNFVRQEERVKGIALGKEMLEREFRKAGVSLQKVVKTEEFEKVVRHFRLADVDELFVQASYGKIDPLDVVRTFNPDLKPQEKEAEEPKSFIGKAFKAAIGRTKKSSSLIEVDGISDVLVRFGKCCSPIPGDPIVGTISRGRGITIHSATCKKAYEVDQGRQVDVSWTKAADASRPIKMRITSQNIMGLLNEMTEVFRAQGVDIHNASIRTSKDNRAVCDFDVSIKNTKHLSAVRQELMKIKGVIDVERIRGD